MRGVALNLFPTSTDDFTFTIYRIPFEEGRRPSVGDEQAVKRNLLTNGKREDYWTLFQPTEGASLVTCDPFDNVYATTAAMMSALIESCTKNLREDEFTIRDGFDRRVEVVLKNHPEGSQVISLEPYLLRSRGKFGFLANFRFRPVMEHRGTRRSQQLSLSLDSQGRSNSNFYADNYSHLTDFVSKVHHRIFPLVLPGGTELDVETRLIEVDTRKLERKTYIVGSGQESMSQFNGVRNSGPLEPTSGETHLYFLYRPEDRLLSHELFRALQGATFPTFPGMEAMFKFPTSYDRLGGIPISDFTPAGIKEARDQVLAVAEDHSIVPVVLTPFSRHDSPSDNSAYWHLKHSFLSKNLPMQVVSTDVVADRNVLKWAASNIGLQIFAKAGGIPWKVRPRKEKSLIVGIGQAHRWVGRRIERYYAYTVLTDSSGVFEEVRLLGEGQDEDSYITLFTSNLEEVVHQYASRFSSFVIHTPFKLRRRELESVARVLNNQQLASDPGDEGEFVALKFNARNPFFGYSIQHNSRMPFESTLLPLSSQEYLVWFEGLQYGRQTVRGMVGGPLHAAFMYPTGAELSPGQKRAHLQDALNLSGANWRGFNAKALPVSVYYAQLVAGYLKEFEAHGLPSIDIDTLTPWFL